MWRTFSVSFACACTNNPWPPLILPYHRVQAKVECFAVCFCTISAILWPSSAHLFLYGLPPLHFVCGIDSFLLPLSGNRAWPNLSVIRYMYTTHIIQPLIPCYIQHVPVHTCTWNVWQETRDKWTANAAVVVICYLIEAGTGCEFEVIHGLFRLHQKFDTYITLIFFYSLNGLASLCRIPTRDKECTCSLPLRYPQTALIKP